MTRSDTFSKNDDKCIAKEQEGMENDMQPLLPPPPPPPEMPESSSAEQTVTHVLTFGESCPFARYHFMSQLPAYQRRFDSSKSYTLQYDDLYDTISWHDRFVILHTKTLCNSLRHAAAQSCRIAQGNCDDIECQCHIHILYANGSATRNA